jgi:hypothetical protein
VKGFSWKRQRQEERKMTQVSRPRIRGQDRLIEREKMRGHKAVHG